MAAAFLEDVGRPMKAVDSVPRYVTLGKLAFETLFLRADSFGDVQASGCVDHLPAAFTHWDVGFQSL